MSSDIAERMRSVEPTDYFIHEDCHEAAAEIERLRAALAVKDNHDHFDCAAAMTKKDVKIETLRELLIDCETERDMYRVAWEMATRAGERDAEPGDPVTHWPASVESSDETLNAVGSVPDCETIAEQIHEEYRATEVGSALPGWPDYYYRDEFAAAVGSVVGPILADATRAEASSDWWAKNAAEKQERIAELEAEIERLKGWKADALRVIEGWDAVFDMVPRESEHLGRSMSDVVAARIAELEQDAAVWMGERADRQRPRP